MSLKVSIARWRRLTAFLMSGTRSVYASRRLPSRNRRGSTWIFGGAIGDVIRGSVLFAKSLTERVHRFGAALAHRRLQRAWQLTATLVQQCLPNRYRRRRSPIPTQPIIRPMVRVLGTARSATRRPRDMKMRFGAARGTGVRPSGVRQRRSAAKAAVAKTSETVNPMRRPIPTTLRSGSAGQSAAALPSDERRQKRAGCRSAFRGEAPRAHSTCRPSSVRGPAAFAKSNSKQNQLHSLPTNAQTGSSRVRAECFARLEQTHIVCACAKGHNRPRAPRRV